MKFPHRRGVLAAFAAVACPVRLAFAAQPARSIALNNIHTGEKLSVDYWIDGAYQSEALASINHVLRDFRTGETHAIEPKLMDLLALLHGRMESAASFEVISGYRSPVTNAMLREEHEHSGVASQSLHMKGMAIDIRLPGRPLSALHDMARSARAGGVGYYPAPDFVHVDVGRVRYW